MECEAGTDYPAEIETWIVDAKATILADMQTDDSCDGTLSIADNYNGTDVPALSCNLSTGLVVTFTVTDDCNNSATCTKTVYIDDTVAPLITTGEHELDALIGCEDGEELIAALAMTPAATARDQPIPSRDNAPAMPQARWRRNRADRRTRAGAHPRY